MGGGRRREAPRKKAAPKRGRRILGRRLRSLAIAAGVVALAAAGTWLSFLYVEISALIDQRRAALTSAVYSAPHRIRAGVDLKQSQLFDRLSSLGYTPVEAARTPGEYTASPSSITISLRGFSEGQRQVPPALVHVKLAAGRITAVEDAAGTALPEALLEPETIGRLLPGAPAERVEIRLADQKGYLVDGLLATEDQYFYYHPGFNPFRILKAAWLDLKARRLAAGASTLTQQLARTFMERRDRSFDRKLRELAMALVLEFRLSKAQILERYINDVSMGSYEGTPIQGLPQAARTFFNKDLGQATPAEAATLIGMVQAPTLYDPRRHLEACTRRRNVVLGAMKSEGVIDDATYASAITTPIRISKPPGLRRAPYFTDYVISFVSRLPGFRGDFTGLKVFTTLDTEIQADTATALASNLETIEKNHRNLRRAAGSAKLQTSAVVLDSRSGAIRAMVGGRDYAASQFNRAALALRQPGSAFKPIVYLAALDPGRVKSGPALTLASLLPDRPMSFGGWAPENYEHTYETQVTTVKALSESLNVPTAYIGSRLGPDLMVRTAHELGISQDLQAVLPISIGADETTLLDLTSAYQVFAAAGTRSPSWAVEAVIDADGRELYRHENADVRVIQPAVAYLITGALRTVLQSGTGAGAARLGLDFPAAGKTGTTQDYKDAYFVGYTPSVVCGVWVGFDSPRSIGLTGAQAALPPWVQIMQKASPSRREDFPQPPGVAMATIDPQSGGLATPDCDRRMALPFLAGTAPTERCPLHGDDWFANTPPPGRNWGGWRAAETAETPREETGRPAPNAFGKVGKFFGSLFRR